MGGGGRQPHKIHSSVFASSASSPNTGIFAGTATGIDFSWILKPKQSLDVIPDSFEPHSGSRHCPASKLEAPIVCNLRQECLTEEPLAQKLVIMCGTRR